VRLYAVTFDCPHCGNVHGVIGGLVGGQRRGKAGVMPSSMAQAGGNGLNCRLFHQKCNPGALGEKSNLTTGAAEPFPSLSDSGCFRSVVLRLRNHLSGGRSCDRIICPAWLANIRRRRELWIPRD